jgi:sugar (pentulose or hexulose) kinase
VIEGAAFDAARCLDLIAPDAEELALAGGGATDPLWRSIVSAVTGRPVVRRAVDDAASVGARLLVASALSESLALDDVNPVVAREEADVDVARRYSALRGTADAIASAVISSVR